MSGRSALRILENVVLTGFAIVLPLFLTLYIIWFVISWIGQILRPTVSVLEAAGVIGFFERYELILFLIETGIYNDVIHFLSEIIAILLFFLLLIVVGSVARYRYGEILVSAFDYLIASVPGIGTVYQTLRRVGNIVAGDNVSEFEAVKLVELLSEETYLIGFQTGTSPDPIADSIDTEELITLFVPMAPNPVTGGFLVYVPRDRVFDVDLSVDEAVTAILTSGLASEEPNQLMGDTTSDSPSSPAVGSGISASGSVRATVAPSMVNELIGSSDNPGSGERSGND